MPDSSLSPEIANVDLEKFMREALLEAATAGRAGELPIGAVLVIGGEIISRGQASYQRMKVNSVTPN
jgi:tRNA(adenine34) deaminase